MPLNPSSIKRFNDAGFYIDEHQYQCSDVYMERIDDIVGAFARQVRFASQHDWVTHILGEMRAHGLAVKEESPQAIWTRQQRTFVTIRISVWAAKALVQVLDEEIDREDQPVNGMLKDVRKELTRHDLS